VSTVIMHNSSLVSVTYIPQKRVGLFKKECTLKMRKRTRIINFSSLTAIYECMTPD
jgi:hypothetical protein